MLIWCDHISREMVKANPNVIFIFGDNLEESGYGGQAKEMRGEPNAIGIPTKRKPTNERNAFFYDEDLEEVRKLLEPIFFKLNKHLKNGGSIVAPMEGVGTGFARLQQTAPTVLAYIAKELEGMTSWRAVEPKKGPGRPPKQKQNMTFA